MPAVAASTLFQPSLGRKKPVPPTLTGTVDTIDQTNATMTAANKATSAIQVPGLAGLIRVSSCSGELDLLDRTRPECIQGQHGRTLPLAPED